MWPEFRRSATVWWAIPLIIFTAVYVRSSLQFGHTPGYGDSVVSAMTLGMVFGVPVVAATAAWDVSRLQRGGVLHGVWSRSQVQIIVAALLPSLVLGWVTIGAALFGVGLGEVESFTPRALTGLIPYVMHVAAGVMVGGLVGRYIPGWLASTLVLVGGYLWFAYPPAMEPGWLRNITGFQSSCCSDSSQFFLLSWLAPGLIAGALIVGVAPWVFGLVEKWRGGAVAASVVVIAAGFFAAAALVSPFGRHLNIPRTDPVVCQNLDVTVCVWPTDTETIEIVAPEINAAVGALRETGLVLPDVLTTAETDSAAWVFGLNDALVDDPMTLRHHVASGLLPVVPGSLHDDSCQASQEEMANISAMRAWLETVIDPTTHVYDDDAEHPLFAMAPKDQVAFVQEHMLEQIPCMPGEG